MTDHDVLIERARDTDGHPVWTRPASRDESGEELWVVTKRAPDQSATIHPKKDAIDLALKWAAETDGKIYLRDKPEDEPTLYEPTA